MKRQRKAWVAVAIFLIFGSIPLEAWAQAGTNPTRDELNMMDLYLARPLAVAAGIAGTGLFILGLPFTIPTRGVDDSARMLIVEPFRFSFRRNFPDENVTGP